MIEVVLYTVIGAVIGIYLGYRFMRSKWYESGKYKNNEEDLKKFLISP